ncbi:MAG: hypothetical protein AAF802_03050 [Planctomycetota bacterium]
MHSQLCRSSWIALFCALNTFTIIETTHGQDFRVAVRIMEEFDDGSQKVHDRRLYLFYKTKGYDFALLEPHDVTVVDPTERSVRLLSRVKNVQHAIQTVDLVNVTGKVRAFAKENNAEQKLGIGAPVVKDLPDYRIAFHNRDYLAKTKAAPRGDIPLRFTEFTDWLARVNLYRRMGSPPFGWMALSNEIGSDNLVPESITLKLTSPEATRTFVYHFEFETDLTPTDQKRVDEVAGMMALYRNVQAADFPR